MDDDNIGGGSSCNNNYDDEVDTSIKELHERLLPIANVGRIMKQVLPRNAKVSKEAKETMQECASEFISFVTSEATEKCRNEKRKTVSGDDVCWAFSRLGLDDYARSMTRYLFRFRLFEENNKTNHREIKRK